MSCSFYHLQFCGVLENILKGFVSGAVHLQHINV